VAGVLFGGWPSDAAARRHPRYRMLIMAASYFAAAPILLTFTVAKEFATIAAAIAIYNFLIGMGYVNSQPLLCELLPQRLRSTAIGLMNMSSCFAGGCGVLLAGFLKSDYGLAQSFASLAAVVFGIACVLAIAYATVLPRDLARSASRNEA
jgi:MFS family permease